MMPAPMFGRALAVARAEDLRAQAARARVAGGRRDRSDARRVRRWRLSLGLALVAAGFRVLGDAGPEPASRRAVVS